MTWFSFCLTKWQHMEDSWEHVQWFFLCHTINFTVNKGDHLCGPCSVFFPCGTSWADQNFKAIISLTSIRPFKGYCLKAGMKLPTERVGPGRVNWHLQGWSAIWVGSMDLSFHVGHSRKRQEIIQTRVSKTQYVCMFACAAPCVEPVWINDWKPHPEF